MAVQEVRSTGDVETGRCTRHPQRETLIGCGRCGRPFCIECLIHSPAGQRCYECAGVRRDYAQRATARRLAQAGGAMLIGGAIASFVGLFGLLIAGMAGSYFGQRVSPAINRRTRPWIYLPVGLALFLGVWVGFSLGTLLQITIAGAGRGLLLLWWSVPFAVLFDTGFWLVLAIAAVVAFLRMR